MKNKAFNFEKNFKVKGEKVKFSRQKLYVDGPSLTEGNVM